MFDVSDNSLTRVLFGSLILSIAFITGCSTTGRITPIAVSGDDGAAVSRGVAFVLPKTILELQITYSLYEKRIWEAGPDGNPKKTDEQGKPILPHPITRLVLIENPIEIAVITIPDSRMSFAFDTEALGAFMKKKDITINLSKSGFIKTTNLVVQDKAKEIVKDLAETTVGLAKLAAAAGTDVAEMILLEEVTVNRQIDPADLDFTKDGELYTAEYSDFEKAELIFEDVVPPAIVVKFVANVNLAEYSSVVSTDLKSSGEDIEELDGIPYRIPGAAKVVLSRDDIEVYSKYHIFSQAGGIAFVPISAEAFSDVTQGLEFADESFALVKYSSKVTAQGEALSAAGKETTATLVKGAKDLRTAEIQAKLDTIKKETELIKAETALAEAIKKKKAAASNP
jgi:hypothetical protein